ncbi:calcium-binding protein [Vibrio agarivorans]|uniref:Calcium-binding protein n=1 Tax=Vibrio agarivorans TaxID=153622 RepID=A0ABT7Y0P5_9VIBR|nr:hypothetical protein [Vibrio agarivorans]MDN2481576.1 hypothetical protein [Vibrio agarivorans]
MADISVNNVDVNQDNTDTTALDLPGVVSLGNVDNVETYDGSSPVSVNGNRGNDTIIVQGDSNDEIRGGKDDDILSAGGGDDFIAAGRGSDLINAGDGNDVVEAWNHSLNAGDEAGDLQTGVAGVKNARSHDVETLGHVDDVVVAGAGSDYVEGGANNDIIYGDRSGIELGEKEFISNGDFSNTPATKEGGGSVWGTYQTLPDDDGISWYANNDGNDTINSIADDGLLEIQTAAVGGSPGVSPNDTVDGNTNVLELDSHNHGGNSTNTTASQMVTVDASEAGDFVLSFEYANRVRGANDQTSPFEVLVNGEVVWSSDNESQDWSSKRLHLDLDQGDHIISFRATGSEDTYGALIDNVSLRQVTSTHDDLLIGDNGPDANVDGSSGDDIIRGNRGDDIIIGDNFSALSFNENTGAFGLSAGLEGDLASVTSVDLATASTAYNPDGSYGSIDMGNAASGGTGYGVESNSESGRSEQLGYSYDDNDGEGDAVGSEMLSIGLEEHTMIAKVGISNLYRNEGSDSIDEVGIWTVLRDGVEVASGFIAAEVPDANTLAHYAEAGLTLDNVKVLSGDSSNNGDFIIGPQDTGFKAFDEIQFTAAGSEFAKGSGQDSSDYFVTSVDTTGLTGDGTDMLYGGRGDDIILAGDNQMSMPVMNDDGSYSLNGYRGELSVKLESSEAGFNNSYGYYTVNDEGILSAHIVWGDVHASLDSNDTHFNVDIHSNIETLGFFIVPDGGDKGVVDGAQFSFDLASLAGGATTAMVDGNQVSILSGENYVSGLFTVQGEGEGEAPSNYDGVLGEGNQHFNDNPGNNSDSDFDDVVTTANLSSSPELLAGRVGDDWLDGGAGVDILKGGKGDDVLIGGSGSDELRGGNGNDILAYDASDSLIHGGRGFDVLIANDKDITDGMDGVTFDLKGATHIKGMEAIIGTSGDDVLDLNLNKVARQTQDVAGNDGNAFFALDIETLNLKTNGFQLQLDGGAEHSMMDIASLDLDVQQHLGLEGADGELYQYTFTKNDDEVMLFTNTDWDDFV